MAIIKSTLKKKDNNEIKNVYLKTSSDMVIHGNTTISEVLEGKVDVADLEALETSINNAITNAIVSTYGLENVSRLIDRTIVSISNNDVTSIGTNAFANCSSLRTALFPNATYIGGSAFNSCSALSTVDFSNVTQIDGNGLYGCSNLTTMELPKLTRIETRAFRNCGLTKFILSATEVATLVATDAFSNTPIASGTGYIYVPDGLVDSYKAASNWSTYSNQIKGLSELE